MDVHVSGPNHVDLRQRNRGVGAFGRHLFQALLVIVFRGGDGLDDLHVREPHLGQRNFSLVKGLEIHAVFIFQNCAIPRVKGADPVQLALAQIKAFRSFGPRAAALKNACDDMLEQPGVSICFIVFFLITLRSAGMLL